MNQIDRQVGQNISILAHIVADVCEGHTLDEASEGSLTVNQFKILKILAHQSDFAVGEIARLLQISSAAASKNIERMVQLGLVARTPLAGDRRRLHLELLPPARGLLGRYDEISATKLQRLLSNFSGDEKQALLGLLRRVIQFTLADERDAELVCLQCAGNCGSDCVIKVSQGSCYAHTNPSLHQEGAHAQSS
jgi:DNA-binding MarR family transcriptional regulator